MITLKLILASSVGSTLVTGFSMFFADMDAGAIVTVIGALISAIFGGIVLIITTRSRTKIDEMKAQVELETVKTEAYREVQKERAEAQKAVALVSAQQLGSLNTAMAVNTAETVKAIAAADQTKARVEQLEQKLPLQKSEADTLDVHVVNPPTDPIPTKPQ